MLKGVAILASAAIIAISVPAQPQKAADREEGSAAQRQQAVADSENLKKRASGPAEQAKNDPDPPKWYASLGRPDWWLVILGFGTLLVVGWQTKILGRSVAVAQKAADAAKTSADIAAGVSIPTLAIDEFGIGDVGIANAEAFFQFPKIKITIKNHGQTPAFLKWWSLCFTCENLPDLPVYEGPGHGMPLEKTVVPPGGAYTLPDLAFFQRQEFSLDDAKAIIKREKVFNAYGYICYGDIFGHHLRRLKFCETVLNIFEGQGICDWWGELAPAMYTGTDRLPVQEKTKQKPGEPK
jgi:hypothetical protein